MSFGKSKQAMVFEHLAASLVQPPTIQRFIDGSKYLNAGEQCCEAVRDALIHLFDPDAGYQEGALIWGIGAGKSYLTSIATAYIAYRVLCLPNAAAHYGLAPGSQIAIANFSVTATQAKAVVFEEIAARIDASPAFAEPGFQRDKTIRSELRWPDRGLRIFPGNSQATSAIGYNILAAVVDEASWLPEVQESVRVAGQTGGHQYDAAEELYNALAKRMLSRGNEQWRNDSLLLMISSPRYVGDFLEGKALEARTNDQVYTSRIPTWAGHPASNLSGGSFRDETCGAVPIEYFEQFKRNPERARRDLGAVPSIAIGGFFSDPAVIYANTDPDMQSPFLADGQFSPGWRGEGMPALHVHVDLGLRRDACGIAGAYALRDGRIVQAFVKRVTPEDHEGEIDFERIRDFIIVLRDVHGWEIKRVTYDGWQSVDSQQMLRKRGITTEQVSVDKDTVAYDTYKDLLCSGRLVYYFDEALVGELSRLELIRGKKVDHPPNGSKDIADAAAGAVLGAAQTMGYIPRMPEIYRNMPAGGSTVTGIDAASGKEVTLPVRTYVNEPDGVIDPANPNAPASATHEQLVRMYPWMKDIVERQLERENR